MMELTMLNKSDNKNFGVNPSSNDDKYSHNDLLIMKNMVFKITISLSKEQLKLGNAQVYEVNPIAAERSLIAIGKNISEIGKTLGQLKLHVETAKRNTKDDEKISQLEELSKRILKEINNCSKLEKSQTNQMKNIMFDTAIARNRH